MVPHPLDRHEADSVTAISKSGAAIRRKAFVIRLDITFMVCIV